MAADAPSNCTVNFLPLDALTRAINALEYRISYIEGHLEDPHTRMPELNRQLLQEGLERDKAAKDALVRATGIMEGGA